MESLGCTGLYPGPEASRSQGAGDPGGLLGSRGSYSHQVPLCGQDAECLQLDPSWGQAAESRCPGETQRRIRKPQSCPMGLLWELGWPTVSLWGISEMMAVPWGGWEGGSGQAWGRGSPKAE